MLDNCQLIHPVHERMTFFDNTLKLTTDTGDQFIPGKQIGRIHRHLFCTQEECLNPLFLELGSLNNPQVSTG